MDTEWVLRQTANPGYGMMQNMIQTGAGTPGYKLISAEETQRAIDTDASVVLLDVRTPEEFRGGSGHIANSLLIPVQELERRINELSQYKDRTIIAYCRSGNRSGRAAAFLVRRGFSAMNMEGGIVKWNELKLPVVHEKAP